MTINKFLIHRKKAIALSAFLALIVFSFFYTTSPTLNPHQDLIPTSFDNLANWNKDKHHEAFLAFKKSCSEIMKLDAGGPFGSPRFGHAKDWQSICLAANKLAKSTDNNAKIFFEKYFMPYAVSNHHNAQGLFTGYYLPLLRANLQKNSQYNVPIYGLPKDLIRINLGMFYPEFAGKTVTGHLIDGTFVPYPDRAAITDGAILKTAPILLWTDNAIDIFFAQIQGSALVVLPNGKQQLIGYAGENGRPYTAIGKVLLQNHSIDKQTISMQTIRAWLLAHPQEANSILNRNASYVFFYLLKADEPLGTEKVPLTPMRSLAVDTHYIPLGAPIWLDTMIPKENADTVPFQHLLVAQDTGGSIKGVVRGDIFCGPGDQATYVAGHMNNKGMYWILLPRDLTI